MESFSQRYRSTGVFNKKSTFAICQTLGTAHSRTSRHSMTQENEKKPERLKKEDRELFMELGFVAASNFLPWEAHALFGQLVLADPEAAYGRVGLAYSKMMGGQFEEAHKLLQHPVVKASKLSAYAVALRGLAFQLEGHSEEMKALFAKDSETLSSAPAAQQLSSVLSNPGG
jgi:hypothetical protein